MKKRIPTTPEMLRSPRARLSALDRRSILPFVVAGPVTVATWAFTIVQGSWSQMGGASGPSDMALTLVPLVMFVTGLACGVLGRGKVGWVGAAGGLVVGSLVAAVALSEPRILQPTVTIIELAPLTLGYGIGYLGADPSHRFWLVAACAIGLWLPFAALALFLSG